MAQTQLAVMFQLFSTAVQVPTKQWAELVVSGELRDGLKASWEALELPQEPMEAFCAKVEPYVGRDAEEVLHELRVEWTHLFNGKQDQRIENAEGPWRRAKQGRNAPRMINAISIEVQDFMRECGVRKAHGTNDCIDYLETEFEFCAMLADNPQYLVDLGKDPLELLERFIAEHIKKWASPFCGEVVAAAREPWFEGAYGLTQAFVDEL